MSSRKHRSLRRSIKRSRKRSRKRSFGAPISSQTEDHLKKFLIIAILTTIRSLVKQNPNSVSNDIKNIEYSALNYLTIASLIDFIDNVFGAKIRDKIILGYLVLSIGLDMSNLV